MNGRGRFSNLQNKDFTLYCCSLLCTTVRMIHTPGQPSTGDLGGCTSLASLRGRHCPGAITSMFGCAVCGGSVCMWLNMSVLRGVPSIDWVETSIYLHTEYKRASSCAESPLPWIPCLFFFGRQKEGTFQDFRRLTPLVPCPERHNRQHHKKRPRLAV